MQHECFGRHCRRRFGGHLAMIHTVKPANLSFIDVDSKKTETLADGFIEPDWADNC
jgi:hypothetical protein